MANITDKVASIRAAIYGSEVRESIASGIEDMNTEVDSVMAGENGRVSAENSRVVAENGRSIAVGNAVAAYNAALDISIGQESLAIADVATQVNGIKEASRVGFLKGTCIPLKNVLQYNNYMGSDSGAAFVSKLKASGVNYVSIVMYFFFETDTTMYCDYNNVAQTHDTTANALIRFKALYDLFTANGIGVGLKVHESGPYFSVSDSTFIGYLSTTGTPDAAKIADYIAKHKAIVDAIMAQCPGIQRLTILNERPAITGTGTGLILIFATDLLTYYKATYPSLQVGISAIPHEFLQNYCKVINYVDFIGVNLYPAVQGKDTATYAEFRQNANRVDDIPIRESLDNMYKTYNKKYIVTEMGCPPYVGAAKQPMSYAYITPGTTPVSKANQMYFLRAMYNNYVADDNCLGTTLWVCTNDSTGTEVFDWFYDSELYANVKNIYGGVS